MYKQVQNKLTSDSLLEDSVFISSSFTATFFLVFVGPPRWPVATLLLLFSVAVSDREVFLESGRSDDSDRDEEDRFPFNLSGDNLSGDTLSLFGGGFSVEDTSERKGFLLCSSDSEGEFTRLFWVSLSDDVDAVVRLGWSPGVGLRVVRLVLSGDLSGDEGRLLLDLVGDTDLRKQNTEH